MCDVGSIYIDSPGPELDKQYQYGQDLFKSITFENMKYFDSSQGPLLTLYYENAIKKLF